MSADHIAAAAEELRELLHERPRWDARDVYDAIGALDLVLSRAISVVNYLCGRPSAIAARTDNHLTLADYDIAWNQASRALSTATGEALAALGTLHQVAGHLAPAPLVDVDDAPAPI